VPSIIACMRNDLWPGFFYLTMNAMIPSIIKLSAQESGILIAEFIFFILILKSASPWLQQLIITLKALEDEFVSNETDLKFQYVKSKLKVTPTYDPLIRKQLFASRILF
jgi:hypothetical protein